MRTAVLFALFALMPASLNAAAVGRPLIVPICRDGAAGYMMIMTGGEPAGPQQQDHDDCPKGCHAGASRKKAMHPDKR